MPLAYYFFLLVWFVCANVCMLEWVEFGLMVNSDGVECRRVDCRGDLPESNGILFEFRYSIILKRKSIDFDIVRRNIRQ